MADPAQAEAPGAAGSPTGIKEEPASIPGLPDLALALENFTSKRSFDQHEPTDGFDDGQTNKRIKSEHDDQTTPQQPQQSPQQPPTQQTQQSHQTQQPINEPAPSQLQPEPQPAQQLSQHQPSVQPEIQQLPQPETQSEPSFDDGMNLEDDMALLVHNALNNASDLMQQYSEEPPTHEPSAEPMDLDNPNVPDLPRTIPDFDLEPHQFLRSTSIRALGSMAMSLLLIMSRTPVDAALSTIRDEETEQKRAYEEASSAFKALKRIYGRSDVISAAEAGLEDPESQQLISFANLAQLGTWLTEHTMTTLNTANDTFLRLIPASTGMSDDAMDLFLAIKTQLVVQSISADTPKESHQEILRKILQDGLEDALRARHEGQDLSTTEQHLVTSVEVRKAAFTTDVETPEGIATLKEKYPMTQLSKSFAIYTRNQLCAAAELALKLGLTVPSENDLADILELPEDNVVAGLDMDEDLSSFFEKTTSGLVQDALAAFKGEVANESNQEAASANANRAEGGSESTANADAPARTTARSDYEELEALVAQSTSDYVKNTLNSMSPMSYVPQTTGEGVTAQSSYLSHLQHNLAQHQFFPFSQQPQPEAPPQTSETGDHLPPNQTCPSAMLYDKARQAALSKSSAHTRREGIHSTRRPWTQEEEKALMAGLDLVKGPHWSQILTLFGPHGTISDILKDRTQVQLKDKARNLKLFFLKTNSEMPYYLQAVTGELKTRAPTQAARKEAEERARMTSDEDQAKLQGIMALAGGLQHHSQPQQGQQSQQSQQPSAAARPLGTVGPGVITPAQAAARAASNTSQHNPGTQTAWRPTAQATSTAGTGQRPGIPTNSQVTTQSPSQGQARPQQGQQTTTQMPRPSNAPQTQHTHAHPQPQQQPQTSQPHPQSTQSQAINTHPRPTPQQHQAIRPAQNPAPSQQGQAARPPQQQQGQAQSFASTTPRPAGQGVPQAQQTTQQAVQQQGQQQAQRKPMPIASNGATQITNGSSPSASGARPLAAQQSPHTATSGAQGNPQSRPLMMPKPQVPSPNTQSAGTPQSMQPSPQQRPQQPNATPPVGSPAPTLQRHNSQTTMHNGLAMPRPQQPQTSSPQPTHAQQPRAVGQSPSQGQAPGQTHQPQPQPQHPRPVAQGQAQPQQPQHAQPSPQTQPPTQQQRQQQPAVQQQPQTQLPAQPQHQAPASNTSSGTVSSHQTPVQDHLPNHVDDDSAEAALLKDLQAAVAGVTS